MTYANMTINDTGIFGLINYANNITDGWVIIMILLSSWFILFVVLKRYETEKALPVSTFIISILAIIFRVIGLSNDWVLMLAILVTIFSVLWLFWSD
jgi:hypothetical protein